MSNAIASSPVVTFNKMATIQSPEIIREIRKRAGIQEGIERTPNQLSQTISATLETNPKLIHDNTTIATYKGTTTGSTSITGGFLASQHKARYITGYTLSWDTDATADNTELNVTAVVGGATIYLARVTKLTTTATSKTISHTYHTPIRIDDGSLVSINSSFTAGLSTQCIVLYGFDVEEV